MNIKRRYTQISQLCAMFVGYGFVAALLFLAAWLATFGQMPNIYVTLAGAGVVLAIYMIIGGVRTHTRGESFEKYVLPYAIPGWLMGVLMLVVYLMVTAELAPSQTFLHPVFIGCVLLWLAILPGIIFGIQSYFKNGLKTKAVHDCS